MDDSDFKGLSRTEEILENMLGATNDLKPPQSRVEALLMELLELIGDISHTAVDPAVISLAEIATIIDSN